MSVAVNLFKIEILVLQAWSQMISSATGQICLWFQVSGFRCQQKTNPRMNLAKGIVSYLIYLAAFRAGGWAEL
jgi:hypothetical protein